MAKPFATLGDADCDAVISVLRARQGLPGDVLFAQGDLGDTLMVIAEGTLLARVRRPSGLEVELARFGPGDIVGELAVVDAQPRSATLVAAERTVVYELSRDGLARLAREAPVAATTLLRSIAATAVRRLRWTTDQIVRQLDGASRLDAAPRAGHDAPAQPPASAPAARDPSPPIDPPPTVAAPPAAKARAAPVLELDDPPAPAPIERPLAPAIAGEAAPRPALDVPVIPELELPRRRP